MTIVNHRAVVITRPSELDLLMETHGTRGQVEFYLRERGRSLEEVDQRHAAQDAALHSVSSAIPIDWRRTHINRHDLDRFPFEPDDVIIPVGQDGLVANVAKYVVDKQPIIGVNPEPDRNPGILVRHDPKDVSVVLSSLNSFAQKHLTMVETRLDDGRVLRALNEAFIGHRSHQSARYTISAPDAPQERQSSSGIIVTTGTGATGWASSIHRQLRSDIALPEPTEKRLAFFVREPWPSPATQTTVTKGMLHEQQELVVDSEMDDGIVFGDGIESDPIPFRWGRRAYISVSKTCVHLVLESSSHTP